MFSVTQNVRARALSAMPGPSPRFFELAVLFGRIERLEARRRRWSGAIATPAGRLDVELLADGAAFEAAWSQEVAALIALKRHNTSRARRVANATRKATERLATRIEAARPSTLDGLKVKARVQLWRRNGEPPQALFRRAPPSESPSPGFAVCA